MKKAHLSILFTLIAFVALLSHWMVFISMNVFWGVEWSTVFVLASSVALPGLFFLATGILHSRESEIARWLYFVSSLWMGLFSFLFFSTFLTWGIFWFGVLMGWYIPLDRVFSFLTFLSTLSVAYGVWNAFHPRVRHVDVSIRNLPVYWEGKNIVQLSDVHLGAVYGAKHFRKIAMMANAEKPEIVVFTGDTFDGTVGWISTFTEPLSRVRAKSGIFFIIGNHETYLGVAKTQKILEGTKISFLDDAVAEVKGLKIVGLSYPERGKKKHFVQTLRKLFSEYQGYPTLLLNHTPEQIKKVSRMGISLQLSGHTHFGQMTPYNLVTHYMHKGFDYGKFEMGDYTLYTTNGIGTWGPPIRFGNTPEVVSITLHRKPDAMLPVRRPNGLVRKAQYVTGSVKKVSRTIQQVAHKNKDRRKKN